MENVVSKDGTVIAYQKSGKGAPLVLVHGTTVDHSYWDPILPELEAHFTVYAMDRRGRGISGDASGYEFSLEIEDVKAVIDKADQPVILLGHSFGGTLSLEAAFGSKKVDQLVLYEPQSINTIDGTRDFELKAMQEIDQLLEKGDKKEEALVVFLEQMVEMSKEEVDYARSTPYWQVMVSTASTLPREINALWDYKFDPSRFRELSVPTLLLAGDESPQLFKEDVKIINDAMQNAEIMVLEGHAHDAVMTAPELFTAKVLEFLL